MSRDHEAAVESLGFRLRSGARCGHLGDRDALLVFSEELPLLGPNYSFARREKLLRVTAIANNTYDRIIVTG